jgi:serine/threonine protein kinase/Tol biopolymer transport system component
MSVAVGSSLGPYEILASLGRGGMGEVYRARDKRLGREVALKVVLTRSAGSEARERFEREARTISSLSHPHICPLYDVGREGEVDYLVMELLEGESLAARLARGPLPLAQLLRYGIQIAEALDHAHRAGVVHRDLKPANIMLTATGAKLLDFGLARLSQSPSRIFSQDSAPETVIAPLTADGMIVGTLHYMSPEQLEGKPLDARSDIFALGVLLYEMATGRRPFQGSSPANLIASILTGDPPQIRAAQPDFPPDLERILRTAVEKDPAERWHSAQDMARQLRWLVDTSSTGQRVAPPRRTGRSRTAMIAIAGVVAGVVLALGFLALQRTSSQSSKAPAFRLHFSAPAGVTPVDGFDTNNFALSPDGDRLAFVAIREGKRVLAMRRLDAEELVAVPGSQGATGPFWSRDGQWLGFSARGKLWKWRVSSEGEPVPICDVASDGAVATWGEGLILFSDAAGVTRRPIMRVVDSGGQPEAFTSVDEKAGEWRHSWPRFLPDGKHFVYHVFSVDSVERKLMLRSLEDDAAKLVMRNISQVAFRGNDLLYVRDGTLFAQAIDTSTGRVEGDPESIAKGVGYFYATASAQFDASDNGVIVFRTDSATGDLVELDAEGAIVRTLDSGEDYFSVNVSRDGRLAAVSIMAANTGLGDIWLYDLTRGLRQRFTDDPGMEVYPIIAPDGASIVFSKTVGGTFPHLVRRTMHSTQDEVLGEKGFFDVASGFSSDGRQLYFTRRDPRTRDRIFRLDTGLRKAEPLLASSFRERDAKESPTGRWLAYSTDATGGFEIYVQDLSDPASPRIRISPAGGQVPRWSKDGTVLYYISSKRQLMRASPGARGWNEARTAALFAVDEVMDYAPTDSGTFLAARTSPQPADALFHVVLPR